MADSGADVIGASNFAGSTMSLSFTGIPQTYQTIRVVANFLTDPAAAASYGTQGMFMRMNGESGSAYYNSYLAEQGGSWISNTSAQDTTLGTYGWLGNIDGDLSPVSSHNPFIVDIINYAADEPTTWQGVGGRTLSSGYSGDFRILSGGVAQPGGSWGVSSIEFYAGNVNLDSNSRVTLIGLKGS